MAGVPGLTRLQRWEAMVVRPDDPDGCWEWTGYRTKAGYGLFGWGRQLSKTTAHRAAYRLLVGEIPDGLHIDHLCRNRGCVNPAHLEPVTNAENHRRGVPATGTRTTHGRRSHCKQGHPLVPLATPDANGRKRRCPICLREAGRRFDARHPERALRRKPRKAA